MMQIRERTIMLLSGCRRIRKAVSIIQNGQETNYAILQTAHRIEKGMCISNPRNGWGYEKAEMLVSLIEKEKEKCNPDQTAISIGESVLVAFIAKKEAEMDDLIRVKRIKNLVESINRETSNSFGGVIELHKSDVTLDGTHEKLFTTRHSIRDFDETPVDTDVLESAINLALHAPSACNRQATQIYVISGQDRIKAGSSNEYKANKYLIITGNMRAFGLSELNDWIVSTSLFCGYLSLALHAKGIGACIFRKDIIRDSKYNKRIRSLCNIPEDEQIILEIGIGNYKQQFKAPVSHRRDASEIIHYIK